MKKTEDSLAFESGDNDPTLVHEGELVDFSGEQGRDEREQRKSSEIVLFKYLRSVGIESNGSNLFLSADLSCRVVSESSLKLDCEFEAAEISR